MRILIVEDEPNLGLTLSEYLEGQGYQCALAATVSEGRKFFAKQSPQVVLMDINLPDGSGLDLAREFKRARDEINLLFLSAMNEPEIKVEGLEVGADDYITKPFALKELTLRLERIRPAPAEIVHGDLKIRFGSFEVEDAQGKTQTLGQKENAILRLLYENRGQALERERIIETIWGKDKFPSNRTVDNYIVRLRKWCESDPAGQVRIESIWGVGYKMMVKGERRGTV